MKKIKTICFLLILIINVGFQISGEELSKGKNQKGLHLEYKIVVDRKSTKYFSINLVISGLQSRSLFLRMTNNYGQVKELNNLIPKLSFISRGKKILGIERVNEFLWKVPVNSSKIEVNYLVNTQYPYSSLNMVRLPFRDENHLCFPSSSVFIHPDEEYILKNNIKINKITIYFNPPLDWIAATTWGVDRFVFDLDPPSLKNLNEALVCAGNYDIYSFKVEDISVDTAVLFKDKEVSYFKTIGIQAIEQGLKSAFDIFHFFPVPKLFAMIHFVYEHPGRMNGNALECSVNLNCGPILNHKHQLEMASHIFAEIFHFWNGQVLNRGENKSVIWFTEGVTNYYRLKNMLSSGFIGEKEFLQFLSEEFNKVFHSPRCTDDLNELSQDYYKDREAMTLTYSKGCCVTFALDLLIREISSNKKSFDYVLKQMIKKYNFKENDNYYTHKDVDGTIKKILGDSYFHIYKNLYGEDFIAEFKSILETAGLSILKKKGRPLYFGILNFGPPDGQVKILSIDRESPAYAAGLRSGDVLISINGQKIKTTSSIKEILETIPKNEPVKLMIIRNEKKISLDTLWNSFATEYVIKKKENNI